MDGSYNVYMQKAQADVTEDPDDMEDVAKQLMTRINVGCNLTDVQRKQLVQVVIRHTEVFSRDDGCRNKVEHRIITTDDFLVWVPHRRIPPHLWGK